MNYSDNDGSGFDWHPYHEKLIITSEGGKKKKNVRYEKRSKKELMDKAKQKNIKGRSGLNKKELIKLLRK